MSVPLCSLKLKVSADWFYVDAMIVVDSRRNVSAQCPATDANILAGLVSSAIGSEEVEFLVQQQRQSRHLRWK